MTADETKVTVLIVDDYEPFRCLITAKLQTHPRLQIIAEASDGFEAVQQAEKTQPTIVLLDVGLPGINGIQAARRIRQLSPASIILFVSENDFADIAEGALHAGGAGYVFKSDIESDLLPAIDSVLAGKRFVSASLCLQPTGSPNNTVQGAPQNRNPYRQSAGFPVSDFLASMIQATGADFGNVQLLDSEHGVLRIVAHDGLESGFLDYFGRVDVKEGCACAKAMDQQSRVIVEDVTTDPVFSNDARGVLLWAKVRSLQSTPLIDPMGNFFGIVSTHYKRRGGPASHIWNRVDKLCADFLKELDRLPSHEAEY